MIVSALIVLSACSSNNDVVNNGLLQKRKHRDGFHFNGIGKSKSIESAAMHRKAERNRAEEAVVNIEPTEGSKEAQQETQCYESQLEREPMVQNRNTHKAARFLNNTAEKVWNEPKTEKKIERTKATNDDSDPYRTAAILSVVFAGISLIIITVPIVNVVFSVLAIVFGRKARLSDNSDNQTLAKIAMIIGLITGILGLIYTLLFAAYIVFFILLLGL